MSEAIFVNLGDRTLDLEAIVDPDAILEWCRSLVRKTPGSGTLELAHYSVKEFLKGINAHDEPRYRDYRADIIQDGLELARNCLTYLCFDDLDIEQIGIRRSKIFDKRNTNSYVIAFSIGAGTLGSRKMTSC